MNNIAKLQDYLKTAAWYCVVSGLMMPSTAFAYVDPGSGSVIVTTILGLIAAIGYTFRKYFYRLHRMFASKSGNTKNNEGE